MHIKYYLKKFIIFQIYLNIKDSIKWVFRNFSPPSPPYIKHKIIKNHLIPNSIFIETGTLIGDTIIKLSKNFSECFTIEPSNKFYNISKIRLKNYKNVKIINKTSEEALGDILKNIKNNNVTFYLDAHDSGVQTYAGEQMTPVINELNFISVYKNNMNNFVVIIDDVRDFKKNSPYPDVSYLFNFAINHNMEISIEHDMFIMKFFK